MMINVDYTLINYLDTISILDLSCIKERKSVNILNNFREIT